MTKYVTLNPKISEKSYALSEKVNTYVFTVSKNANKHDVARSVSTQFNVTVERVRLSNLPGKPKRTIRKGGRSVVKGQRGDIRKAYVTLAKNDKLPIFAAVEEASAPEEKK